jgi:FADH2 O2-dependent halogenase
MLPQTFAFFDPLFSTGLAWSLLGVERLATVLETGPPTSQSLGEYDALLRAEADQQQALLAAAYAARRDFPVFRDVSFLYFACASFEELRQRLLDGPDDVDSSEQQGGLGSAAWRGFLGARDTNWTASCGQAAGMARATVAEGSDGARRRFSAWVATRIASRNVVGLGESPTHLYGVDMGLLVKRGGLLGLTEADVEERLPRLRGGR